MKKRKTYEISVIDKTYSKTISDETKFYTSDTTLELVFKLKETEYIFESAEIVLFNVDDRSLVTRPVVKNLDSFTYELEDDITAHYGEWHGQLRFEQAGETYVSSPVKFRIENDLGSERPPQLSDVQSWVSLKRYADSLTEELKQAVMDVEGIEDTFNTNETVRQSQFDSAEQSRQTTFEVAESERDGTFSTNETARQTQELEREKAEDQRQTVFDENEDSRTRTFNTNEARRQTNETTRQQAETQRVTAESSRAIAEEQRKTDHANRSAELAGKADKVVLRNLVTNGDFNDELTGWYLWGNATVDNPSYSLINNNLVIDRDNPGNGRIGQDINCNKHDKLYINVPMSGTGRIDIHKADYGSWNNLKIISSEITTSFSTIMGDREVDNVRLGVGYVTASVYDNRTIYSIQVINLTQTFGAGNEPTKEEMDELIKITGYIDGEYALNSKELLVWTLSLVRNNRNAIISLGGTI